MIDYCYLPCLVDRGREFFWFSGAAPAETNTNYITSM